MNHTGFSKKEIVTVGKITLCGYLRFRTDQWFINKKHFSFFHQQTHLPIGNTNIMIYNYQSTEFVNLHKFIKMKIVSCIVSANKKFKKRTSK